MRRLSALGLLLLAVAAFAVTLTGATAEGSSTYRVDAIFDDAKGLIPGQLVKIAGAKVGTISGVTLTPDFKARIQLSIDGRFAPFRTDASCAIEPEGLIAENYVNCDPGSPSAARLQSTAHNPPTVPVTHNAEPVSITDLFNVWNTPTQDRVRVLINELGAGVAGRGTDINAILLRSNPALALARKAIALVNSQRVQLQQILSSTDPVVTQLAQHSPAVQRFLDAAASATATAANHSGPLAQAINRLPALLRATRPALEQLDILAAAGAPVLSDLHAAAPSLNRAIGDLIPFSAAAVPALRKLGPALANTTTTLRNGAPVVAQLRTFAVDANTPSQDLARLAVNFRTSGVIDNLMGFIYNAGGLLNRFDATSHLGVVSGVAANQACDQYAQAPTTGCSAWYPNQVVRAAPRQAGRAAPRAAQPQGASAPPATQTPQATRPTAPTGAAPPQNPVSGILGGVQQALGGVLGQVQGIIGGLLPPAASGGNHNSSSQGPLQTLLGYLLK